MAVPSWYLVPAILCGNAVVWKPAEYTPALGDALAALHRGRPAGRRLQPRAGDGPTAFEGLEQALDEGLVSTRWASTGSSPVGSKIGNGRPPWQSACLRPGREEPARGDAGRRPRPRGRGQSSAASARRASAAPRSAPRSFTSRSMTSSSRLTRAVEEAPIGDPARRCSTRPMIRERFAERFEDGSGWIRDHHRVGLTGTGRIRATTRAPASLATRTPASLPPTIVDGVPPQDEITGPRRSARSSGSRPSRLRRGVRARQTPRLRAVVGGLHERSEAVRFRQRVTAGMVSVINSQGRGGPPALRAERHQSGQRLAPVRHLGAGPIHPRSR